MVIWSYAQIIFLAGFASQRVLNKDPTVWLDGARPLPTHVSLPPSQGIQLRSHLAYLHPPPPRPPSTFASINFF